MIRSQWTQNHSQKISFKKRFFALRTLIPQAMIGLSIGILAPQMGLAATTELTAWEEALPDEESIARDMGESLVRQLEKDYVDQGKRVFRDAHSHGIGCVEASFQVDPDLPLKYRTGVFKEPGKTFPALIRFSNSLGPAGDHVKDARGMAIKLIGVDGPKLLSSQESAVTHDFLQIDAPYFPARDAREFAGLISIKSSPAKLQAPYESRGRLSGRASKS